VPTTATIWGTSKEPIEIANDDAIALLDAIRTEPGAAAAGAEQVLAAAMNGGPRDVRWIPIEMEVVHAVLHPDRAFLTPGLASLHASLAADLREPRILREPRAA
jgi:hypothetical protein